MFLFFFSLAWAADIDQDGYDDTVDCDDNNAEIYPEALEICDGLDNDCDELIDEALTITYWPDADEDGYGDPTTPTPSCEEPEGYVNNNQDCNDNDASIYPTAEEICDDGIDNDCNFVVDDGCEEPEPAQEPTEEPATEPTSEPTQEPTSEPTSEPTQEPTQEPTSEPTSEPTTNPPTSGPVDLKDDEGCAGAPLWFLLPLLFRNRKRKSREGT